MNAILEISMNRLFRQKWALVFLVPFMALLLGGVVHAAAGINKAVLYYDDADKNSLRDIFENGEKQSEIGDMMKVVVKGGVFGNGTVFSFTTEINDQMNKRGVGGADWDPTGDDDSHEYFAVAQLYCGNNKISLTTPTDRPYYKIDYVLGYRFNDWSAVQSPNDYQTHAGITNIIKMGATGDADEDVHRKGANTSYANLSDNDNNNPAVANDGSLGKDIDSVLPADCNNALPRDKFDTRTDNYYGANLTDDDRKDIKKIVDAAGGTSGSYKSGDIPCVGGAMGWILCPVTNYMADGIRAIASFIDGMMQFRLLIGSSSGSGIRAIMNSFVNLANIMLVIAFLIVIFSQSSSIGLSNYNIKRMLPRIIIAAILINLSFYICAFAIDLTNIIGNSILGFVSGQGNDATISSGIAEHVPSPSGFQKVFGTILTAAVGIILLVMFFTPLIMGILVTFIILVARQVILLFLVVVAPLAFAAWLLPNTESWFKKWKDLFVGMLMAYPIVMLVFGIALFAADFISSPEIQNEDLSGGIITSATVGPIIPLVVLAIPLLALPFILKSSTAMLGRVSAQADKFLRGAKVDKGLDAAKARGVERGKFAGSNAYQSLYKKADGSDRVGSGALKWAQDRRRRSAAYRQARQKILEGRKAEAEHDINSQMLGALGEKGHYEGLAGEKLQQAVIAEEVKANKAIIENMQAQWKQEGISPDEIANKLAKAIADGDAHTIEAGMGSLAKMGAYGQNQIAETIGTAGAMPDNSQAAVERAMNDSGNYDSLIAGAGGVAKGKFDANGEFQLDYLGLNTEQTMKQSAQSAQYFSQQATHDLSSGDADVVKKARTAVDNAHRIVSDPRLATRVDSATLAHLEQTANLKTW
ncbi:MAG: hypothetical protein Q7T74_07570 [Candidatus Saccharibacteria bacterium]|nr:hypothetical protein [Candidatus Saccharibacteria bacterium]